ncbi:2-succinyl-5-enolpyruvyl-6-hydroxy-3-cyclohexene-1-carboxylic-acid synthase [Leucobacter sp. CX87]|uniref:2-succinyl-5-enolpyruvyl-6-hydroxy-3- cyclohexene-1-carboxylic-acid synthase n=1 Tax=unclassified Leucobacter TaxID=2621730 RepID=UPI003340167D
MSVGSSAAPASLFAAGLLAELIQRGLRDVVVCPGSRSQALAFAAAEAEALGVIRLHVRIDERSAAFLALGLAKESGVPAAVVVTSGTAVANLIPAAAEAHHSRVPMLLLTADRPADMRGIRSNQTTVQAGLISAYTRIERDVAPPEDAGSADAASTDPASAGAALAAEAFLAATGRTGPAPGPVHLNLAFREPLSGGHGLVQAALDAAGHGPAARVRAAAPTAEGDIYTHDGDSLAVVVAGAGAGDEAEAFAHAAGLPLLAEVVSGARFGREAIANAARLAGDENLGGLVERAIVFGHPTLSRQLPALLVRDDVETIVVDPAGEGIERYNPGRSARIVRAARVGEAHDPSAMRRWLGAWVLRDRELQAEQSTVHAPDLEAARATGYKERNAYARAEVAAMREPVTRELLAETIWRGTWPHDRLVLAASRLVRVLDGIAAPRKVRVHANRGLAGIDGTIATGLGIALASQSSELPSQAAGVTRVLIGDLALLHDAGSLMLTEGEPRPRIQIFVGNDGGGGIFSGLEAGQSADRAAFDRVMFTPQHVNIEQLAAAYGWEYARVESRSELERAFTVPVAGPCIVEIPLTR